MRWVNGPGITIPGLPCKELLQWKFGKEVVGKD